MWAAPLPALNKALAVDARRQQDDMQWTGEGIILATRKLGETSVILEVMTRDRGRHLGVVRGGRSRKMQAALQPGNEVGLVWRARIDDQLGTFTVEPQVMRAASLMTSPTGVYGIQTLAALLHLLPERDPHPQLFDGLETLLEHLNAPPLAGPLMVHFELQLLADLGFGLDLGECAATGTTTELIYVSPKSGRAVCREAGRPYAGRLLALPAFLRSRDSDTDLRRADRADIVDAFTLTGYFLHRYVYEPRSLDASPARDGFVEAVKRALAAS